MENFTINSSKQQKSGATVVKATSIFAIALLIAGAGFFGGMQFQKSQTNAVAAANGEEQGSGEMSSNGPGGQGMQMNGTMGEVTEVSSTSITVTNERASSAATYTITSSTTITEDGSDITIDDVQTGDTVMVSTDSSDSTVAASIQLNPTMGMGGGNSQSSSISTKTN